MEYKDETSFIKYIEANKNIINGYEQPAIDWTINCQYGALNRIPNCTFRELVKDIPPKLKRKDVVSCFNDNLYKGVIATLLWGGALTDNSSNFNNVISLDKNVVCDVIRRIKDILVSEDIEGAFNSMLYGENKLKGIGPSYITKILYFISSLVSCPNKPLIFDSVARLFHCAILIDRDIIKANKIYYLEKRLCYYKKYNRKNYYDLYNDYMETIRQTALDNKISCADKLEAFLFGVPLVGPCKNCNMNPRYVAKSYVEKKLKKSL